MIPLIADTTGFLYQNVLKSVFFRFPADRVHENLVRVGAVLGSVPMAQTGLSAVWGYQSPILQQKVAGIDFPTPLGLAAGFDYNAQLTQITASLGFGWHTVGTITRGSYDGNQPPMLGRLPHSRSLWVNKGFKNPGSKSIVEKLSSQSFPIPLGISIGATNKTYTSIEEQIDEYVRAFADFEASQLRHSYYELNISCPNLSAGTDFQNPKTLKKLLSAVDGVHLKRPVFVKMPIDTPNQDFISLIDEVASAGVAGIIVGNLTKDRGNPALFQTEAQRFTKGGFSGKPTFHRSNEKIRLAHRHAGKKLTVVGTGGIFTAEDAYQKIRNGASLLQMITGMIYQGPQVVGQIHRDLARLLLQDGFNHISEAVGVE